MQTCVFLILWNTSLVHSFWYFWLAVLAFKCQLASSARRAARRAIPSAGPTVLKARYFRKKSISFGLGKWSYMSVQCSSFVKTTLHGVLLCSMVITLTNRNQSDPFKLKVLKNSRRDCQVITKWRKQFFQFN